MQNISGNPWCWAAVLGDCSKKRSREHWISKNQFSGGTVSVQGFPWCRDEPMPMGLERMVSRNLCEKHNNALSEVDDEAAKLLRTFRNAKMRTSQPTRQSVQVHHISADRIERWLLKTTINLASISKPRPLGLFDDEGRPSPRYVQIVYGKDRFNVREGLHWIARPGEDVDKLDRLEFAPWYNKDDQHALVGSLFSFHGHRLWLALEGAPELEDAIYPINRINAASANIHIVFNWNSQRRRQFRSLRMIQGG